MTISHNLGLTKLIKRKAQQYNSADGVNGGGADAANFVGAAD